MAVHKGSSPSGFSPNLEPSTVEPADSAVFDPSLIPVAPVHDFRLRADMRFSEAAAASVSRLDEPPHPGRDRAPGGSRTASGTGAALLRSGNKRTERSAPGHVSGKREIKRLSDRARLVGCRCGSRH